MCINSTKCWFAVDRNHTCFIFMNDLYLKKGRSVLLFIFNCKWGLQTLLDKRLLTRVFSCEFCKISKNIFFYRTPPVAASIRRRSLNFLQSFNICYDNFNILACKNKTFLLELIKSLLRMRNQLYLNRSIISTPLHYCYYCHFYSSKDIKVINTSTLIRLLTPMKKCSHCPVWLTELSNWL